MKLFFKYFGPAILWALFILAICSVPMGDVGKSRIFFPGFDKLVHCGIFFVLTVLYCYGSIRKGRSGSIPIGMMIKNALLVIGYGGLIEILQARIFTWRSGDWNDLFADTIGIGMGIFAVLLTGNAISYEKN